MRLWEMIIAALVVWAIVLTADLCWGHEPDQWVHGWGVPENSWQVQTVRCELFTTVVGFDSNDDGQVDQCRMVMLADNIVHTMPTKMTVEIGRIYCTCETFDINKGEIL